MVAPAFLPLVSWLHPPGQASPAFAPLIGKLEPGSVRKIRTQRNDRPSAAGNSAEREARTLLLIMRKATKGTAAVLD